MPHQPDTILLDPGEFAAIRERLAAYGGIYLDSTTNRLLGSGIAQRLRATGMARSEYIGYLGKPAGRGELHRLSELVLNHETMFFRNALHMEALRSTVLPELHRQKPPGEPLRIWSAGCATGEEPYSLAMLALETLGNPPRRPVEIWATDLSETALEKARRGIYQGRTLTNLTPTMRRRYFEPRGTAMMVTAQVRDMVSFEQVNLLNPFPYRAQHNDIIFCQNVTIYFQLDTFRRLIERFYDVMPQDGMLFLGFSETLWNVFDKLELRDLGGAFAYVKSGRARRPGFSVRLTGRPSTGALGEDSEASWSEAPRPTPRQTGSQINTAERWADTRRIPVKGTSPVVPPDLASAEPAPLPPHDDAIDQGYALLAAGRAADALAFLDQVPLNGPHAPQVLVLIAHAHANRGEIDLAIAEARRALELDSLTSDAYMLLGMLYMQQEQFADAIRQFERTRYLQPEAPLVSFHLAEAYRRLERTAAAAREYRNTVQKLAGESDDSVIDGVAVAWLRETCQRYLHLLGAG